MNPTPTVTRPIKQETGQLVKAFYSGFAKACGFGGEAGIWFFSGNQFRGLVV
jgi:hypothetical protein